MFDGFFDSSRAGCVDTIVTRRTWLSLLNMSTISAYRTNQRWWYHLLSTITRIGDATNNVGYHLSWSLDKNTVTDTYVFFTNHIGVMKSNLGYGCSTQYDRVDMSNGGQYTCPSHLSLYTNHRACGLFCRILISDRPSWMMVGRSQKLSKREIVHLDHQSIKVTIKRIKITFDGLIKTYINNLLKSTTRTRKRRSQKSSIGKIKKWDNLRRERWHGHTIMSLAIKSTPDDNLSWWILDFWVRNAYTDGEVFYFIYIKSNATKDKYT